MTRTYLIGLLLLQSSVLASAEEPGGASRYLISCDGTMAIGKERPTSEPFTWIVDEAAPTDQKIFHHGKSACDGTSLCTVEIQPYEIRLHTVMEGTESGHHLIMDAQAVIDRVHGWGEMTGYVAEVRQKVVGEHQKIKGSYTCRREPFHREI